MTSEEIASIQIYVSIAFFLLPIGELIFKKSDGNLFKRITPVGFACLFIAIVFGFLSKVGLTAFQKEQQSEKHIADSIRELDKKEVIKGFEDAVGKYGYGYDSAKQEIVNLSKLIKDSANRKTIIIEGENPVVDFDPNNGLKIEYLRNDTLKLRINILSNGAGSIVNYARAYIMLSKYNIGGIFKDLHYMGDQQLLSKNKDLAKGSGFSYGTYFHGDFGKVKSIIILITGRYTNSIGKNQKYISDVGILNIELNTFASISTPYDDDVINFLKNKGILDK